MDKKIGRCTKVVVSGGSTVIPKNYMDYDHEIGC